MRAFITAFKNNGFPKYGDFYNNLLLNNGYFCPKNMNSGIRKTIIISKSKAIHATHLEL